MLKKLSAGLLVLAGLSCVAADPNLLAAPKRPSPNAPSFSINDISVDENDGHAVLTITKTGSARSSSVVRVRTVNSSAISGTDYIAIDQNVAFSKNTTSAAVHVELVNDTVNESPETFRVVMTAGSNAIITDNTGVVTIADDDEENPTTKVCPDGEVIPILDDCPDDPPEEPGVPDWEDSPNGTGGATFVAGGFTITEGYSTGNPIPGPDLVVGAFRFICGAGQLSYNDPIVFPGQEGASHLHQFYGNLLADHNSTYNSLRTTGGSTCNDFGDGTKALNRSAYWMPAMLNGAGKVVRPDYVTIYYKRRPITDPLVSDPANPRYEGQAVDLPNGLKFIFGYDMVTGKTATGSLYFNCVGPGATQGKYATIAAAKPFCPAGSRIGAVIMAPSCWDGTHLDSPNHRDHMAYKSYGSWGYPKCPSTHPYVIPDFLMGAWYSVEAGDNLDNWLFSSDAMHPSLPKGTTFHADFWMAWDEPTKTIWHANCINLLLSCSGGQLGDGKMLRGAAVPIYNGVTLWKHPERLVDVPAAP